MRRKEMSCHPIYKKKINNWSIGSEIFLSTESTKLINFYTNQFSLSIQSENYNYDFSKLSSQNDSNMALLESQSNVHN